MPRSETFVAIPKGHVLRAIRRRIVLEKGFNPPVVSGQGQGIQQTVVEPLEKRQQGSSFRLPFSFSADDADDRLCRYVVGHETLSQRNVTSSAPGKIAGAEGRVGSQLHACLPPIYVQKLFDEVQRLAASTLARITNTVKSPILATDKITIPPVSASGRVSRKRLLWTDNAGSCRPSRKGHVGNCHHDSGGLGTGPRRSGRSDHAHSGLFPLPEGLRCCPRGGRGRSDPLR